MRQCRADNIFDVVNVIICIGLLLIFLYPLYFVVIASISDPYAVWNGEVLFWPIGITLDGYREIMTFDTILTGYRNSILYTAGSIALGLVLTISAAYPLSQPDFYMGGLFSKLLLFTMFFSGGLIPFGGYICKEELYEAAYGSVETCFHHTATYQENGISAAAGLASLEYILEHDLISAAAEKGEYFIGELKRIGEKYPGIFKEIRGKGLMIGLETYETPEAYKLQFGDYYADAFEKSVKKIYETVNG